MFIADFLFVLSLHLVPFNYCLAHFVHLAALVVELKIAVDCCLVCVFLHLLFELLHVLLLLRSHLLDLRGSQSCHSLVQLNSSLHCDQFLQLLAILLFPCVDLVENPPCLWMLVLEVLVPPVIVKLSSFLVKLLTLVLLLVVDHHLQFSIELFLLLPCFLEHHCFSQVPLLLFLLLVLVGHEDVEVVAEGFLERVLFAHRFVELLVVF